MDSDMELEEEDMDDLEIEEPEEDAEEVEDVTEDVDDGEEEVEDVTAGDSFASFALSGEELDKIKVELKKDAPAAKAITDADTIAKLKAAWDTSILGDSPYAQE